MNEFSREETSVDDASRIFQFSSQRTNTEELIGSSRRGHYSKDELIYSVRYNNVLAKISKIFIYFLRK